MKWVYRVTYTAPAGGVSSSYFAACDHDEARERAVFYLGYRPAAMAIVQIRPL